MKEWTPEEIEARMAKITPGPWRFEKSDGYITGQIVSREGRLVVANERQGTGVQLTVDAEFIADAPTMIRLLLAQVKCTQRGNARLMEKPREAGLWLSSQIFSRRRLSSAPRSNYHEPKRPRPSHPIPIVGKER